MAARSRTSRSGWGCRGSARTGGWADTRRQGWDRLADRRSGPRTSPSKTAAQTEERVLAARLELRPGPDHIAAATGVPARTVTRTRAVTASRCRPPATRSPGTRTARPARSGRRYEHPEPGAMIHLDVKKLGRIPDGGARRAHGRSEAVCGRGIGYDHVHTAIDDHTHPADAEVLPDDKGTTCAAFPTRAAASFTAHGITRIHRVPTDDPRNHRHSAAFQQACTELGTRQKLTRPHYPNPAVRDPTEKPNASTAPRPPNGPPSAPTPTTTSPPAPWPPGSSTTTPNTPTPSRAASHPSPDCNQDHDRVHPGQNRMVSAVPGAFH